MFRSIKVLPGFDLWPGALDPGAQADLLRLVQPSGPKLLMATLMALPWAVS